MYHMYCVLYCRIIVVISIYISIFFFHVLFNQRNGHVCPVDIPSFVLAMVVNRPDLPSQFLVLSFCTTLVAL